MPTNSFSSEWRVIDDRPPNFVDYCREVYNYRQIGFVLVRRDLIVRFRQTYFGLAWLLFKPLMLMAVMSFAFGFLAGFDKSHSAPYPLVVFCGVIPWYFFSNAVPDSMNSLLGHIHIIQKTYFPRAIIPFAAVSVDAIEFVVAWLLFTLACLWFGYLPGWQIVFLPLLCLQLLVLCASLGLLLAVVNVQFRDIGNLVPFLLTIGFFVTPVGYTAGRIPQDWQMIYALNPLVGIIEGLRWSLLNGANGFPRMPMVLSLTVTLAISVTAVRHFLATEAKLVDLA